MKKENLKLLILIGIPGSGKSTWAKDYVKYNDNWVRVNRDDFRDMLKTSQVCENKIEDMITKLVNETISSALMRKLNVIVDNTHVKVKYINSIVEEFKYSCDIDYRVFDVSIDKAIERDSNREKKVGSDVIKRMYGDYKILMDSFSFQPVTKIKHRPIVSPNFSSNLQDAVIFDIDGTLANMGNRGPFDWDKVYKDDVNHIVAEQVKFHKSLGRDILIVTGRDAVCKEQTIEWLELYEIQFDEIFTRPENDFRKDTVIKKEIYENQIKGNYNVLCVYDDRLQVLDMWYGQKVFTFNVNQGNYEF